MGDQDVSAPDAPRRVVRAGTMDPFKKDAADLAEARAKGEAKRPVKAETTQRRLGPAETIRDRLYREKKAEDEAGA